MTSRAVGKRLEADERDDVREQTPAPRGAGARRSPLCAFSAGVLTVALCLSAAPAALADHGPSGGHHKKAYPTKAQVDAAKAEAARRAKDVGAIKGALLLANQRLDQASTAAEQASEAYNGAMWRLQVAAQKLKQAQKDAARARAHVADQRDAIASLVVTSYQQGTQLSSLTAVMGSDGPEGVMDQYAAFQGASTSLKADYERFAASDALAQVFEHTARQAKVDQVKLAAKARVAKQKATVAARQAQAAAVQIAAEKNRLIHALAKAQNISVRLAQKRQTALEEIARRRAEARARALALAAARAKAAAEARAKAAAAARAKAHSASQSSGSKSHDGAKPPPTAPPTSSAGPSSGGVSRAIAFAEAQLGEPYQWGATGPSSWDCSGLTQAAWGAAGIYLPHYSVAQYDMGTPISVSDARPGDLLFWSSNGAPSGIHHVALYLGGGNFIEAPHTGADVRYNSIYSWYPNFAVRL